MPATIDVLQIEIESSSGKAESGIRGLANALGELKKNGTITTAVKNLNELRKALQLFNNIPSNASKVLSLAQSLSELKSVGSVSTIANSLTKLADGMKTLGTVDVGNVAPKIKEIAAAVAPLSEIKAGGLGTMVNALSKIDKVTDSLNDEVIERFAQRIQKLSDKLTPLSSKMTTVQAGLRGINSNAKSAGKSVKDMGDDLNASSINLSSFIYSIQEAVGWLQQAIQKFSEFIADAIEWDGISARFGRTFGENAEKTYNWIQRLNEEMGINVQQFMQYSSLYAQMLTGFGVAAEDAQSMAVGYTELTYDIWASANDRYKTFEDAADAVASAIAGEVEPIRRAGFTIVESTLEETAAYHGLDISMANATESQKSYLRYLTLVDQAHSTGTIGVYAKELNTAEGLMRTFSQQLKSLSQAFGSLFLPILTEVMPYLTAFVDLLIEAVNWLGALFGFKIQEVDWSGVGDGVGNLDESVEDLGDNLNNATQAAKDLKKATLGIDELNVISPSSSTSTSGSSGSDSSGFSDLTVESLWDESIFKDVQDKVDEIKSKLENDLLPLIGTVGAALALWKISNLLDQLNSANTIIKGLSTGLKIGAISILVGKLVWDFTDAYLEEGDWESFLSGLGTTAIGSLLAWHFGRKSGIVNGGKAGFGLVLAVSGFAMLGSLLFNLSEGTVDFGDPEAWITLITGSLEAAIGTYFTWKAVKPVIEKLWPKITTAIMTAIGKIMGSGTAAGGGAAGAGAGAAGTAGGGAALATAGWVVGIVAYIASVIAFGIIDYDFTEVSKAVGKKIGEALKSSVDRVVEGPKLIAAAIAGLFKSAMEFLDVDTLVGLVEALFEWNTWVGKILPAIDRWTKNICNSIVTALSDWRNNFKGNWSEVAGGFWSGFLGAFGVSEKDAKEFADTLITPEKALALATALGGKFSPGLLTAITESLKTDAITTKIKDMWNNAKTWWNEKKGNLSAYTPSIGSLTSKLYSSWKSAVDWWNKSKGTLRYTPLIGSIKDKLSSAWTTAKNWWSRSKGSMSYTPSIGSIIDKLKSAWNTAKEWWNKNVKLSIPSLSFKVTYETKDLGTVKKAIVSALGLKGWPKLSFAANGGIFDTGSLIWAGERGPEVMATAAGGKTGVMNVDQMQDAVFEGVYSAVMAAMSRGNGNSGQNVNVYLDGKQIYSSVKRTESERGMTLMGNQLGYNF